MSVYKKHKHFMANCALCKPYAEEYHIMNKIERKV